MDGPIEHSVRWIRFRLTDDDVREWASLASSDARFHNRRAMWFWYAFDWVSYALILTAFSYLFGEIAVLIVEPHWRVLSTILGLLIIATALSVHPGGLPTRADKALEQPLFMKSEIAVGIDEAGVTVRFDCMTIGMEWRHVSVRNNPAMAVMFCPTAETSYPVPRRAFTDAAAMDRFVALIESRASAAGGTDA